MTLLVAMDFDEQEKIIKKCLEISNKMTYSSQDVFFMLTTIKRTWDAHNFDYNDNPSMIKAIVGMNGKGDCTTCAIYTGKKLIDARIKIRAAHSDDETKIIHDFICIQINNGLLLMNNSRKGSWPLFLPEKVSFCYNKKDNCCFFYEPNGGLLIQSKDNCIEVCYKLDKEDDFTNLLKRFRNTIENFKPIIEPKDTSFDVYDNFVNSLQPKELNMIDKSNLALCHNEIMKKNKKIDLDTEAINFRDKFKS
jgi:hypothetical protein